MQSISKFFNAVEAKVKPWLGSGPIWYRGEGDTSYNLLPKMYRDIENTQHDFISKLEKKTINYFRNSAFMYYENHKISDYYETLFLMQHFGSPTRLLDWTLNPLVALYFACNGKDDIDSRVWILNVTAFNKWAFSHRSNATGEILSVGDLTSNGYNFTDSQPYAQKPVAIVGKSNSERIIAQRGTFILFGSDVVAINNVSTNNKFIKQIVIEKQFKKQLRNLLFNFGYSRGFILPGLDSVSEDIQQMIKDKTL